MGKSNCAWPALKQTAKLPSLVYVFLILLLTTSPSSAATYANSDSKASDRAVTDQPAAVLFIDAKVEDAQELIAGVAANVKVVALQDDADGVQQIAAVLKNYHNLESIQIVSHGAPGRLALGSSTLSDTSLDHYRSALLGWGEALGAHGSILLYGCNVAQGAEGDHFVNRIGQLTGASVAASTDATGSVALGGNWTLEKQTGTINVATAISGRATSGYGHLLPLPPNGLQSISSGWANGSATLTGFVSGFTFTNNTSGTLVGDTVNGGIYDSTNTSTGNTTTWTVNADGVNLGSFDLTAVSMLNVAGAYGSTANYTFNFTGYKMGGGTVSATGTLNYSPGGTTTAWSSAPNFTSFTGITGLQVTFTAPSGSNNSNVTFQSFTIANATAPAAAPTFTSITPASGPTTGGTAVTITGTNFTGATSVTIGGVAATSVVVVNATTITAVTPPNAAGIVAVAVTTPGGTATGAGAFTYNASAPTVTAISPNSGPTVGGTAVTITGTSFSGATSVTIGGMAVTGVTIVNATTITATTPPGTAGAQNVQVTTSAGTGTGTGLFTYIAPPAVTAITPTSGPTAGGTAVTITGTNFVSGATVTIGGTAATSVVVVNATTITAVTPAGTAGAKNVVVTTAGGIGTGTGLYTYVAPPTVTAISPISGPTAGGTAVTITGTNFVAGATVTIGGAAATGVTVVNATTITATAPAGTAGAKNVVVTTTGGTGTGTGLFTYVAAPTVTAISPTSGPTAGGTAVTITGTNFVSGATVTIGGAAATSVVVVNATTITAVTPAGTAGAQNVVVTTSNGTGTGTGLFTYVAAPTVTAISPTSGPTAGGTAVTITGTNFVSGATVTIGGTAATSVAVVNATTITAVTPAGTAGAKNVVVTTAGGIGTGTGLFSYIAAPTVTAISPSSGPTAGGTSVTITGTNFVSGATVTIGGTAATSVAVVNATTITAVTPAGTAGAQSVVVTTAGGTGTGTGLFTYIAGPTVTAITPATGPTAGGTAVTITGTNLTGATNVTIGGAAATSVVVVNGTTITAVTPAGTAGAQNVAVTTVGGTATGTGLFTYASSPTVTGVSPNSGPTAGGTAITITGANFTGTTSVTIGGTAATSVVVVNATTVTAVTPAGTAGAKNVVVTTPIGTATGTGLFSYAVAPTANAANITVSFNTATTQDMAPFITGGTATSVNISTVPLHGTMAVNGTKITYTPAANYSGADAFSYTATGVGGTSAPAVVTVAVVSRPDPTQDAAVTGMINVQTETAKRFRDAQMFNIQQRLESRHHATQSVQSSSFAGMTKALALVGGAQGGGGTSSSPNGSLSMPASGGRSNSPAQLLGMDARGGTGSAQESGAPGAVGSAWIANTFISAVTTSSVNLNLGTLSKAMLSDGGAAEESGDLVLWGAGNLRFGTGSQTTGGAGVDFTTSGATLGMDKRFSEQLMLGMGVGYARDNSSIGADGTGSYATGNSVAVYASYQASSAMFVDAMLGYGSLNFDTTRFVAAVNDFARASRSGSQTWGSLATGYEYRDQGLLLSPYARYNLGVDQLNATTESGASIYALNYDSQSIRTQQLSFGFRAESQHQTDIGLATPRARIEYQHVIQGDSQTSLAYADTISSRYNLTRPGANYDSWLAGIGSGLALRNAWRLDAEYQRQHSVGQENIQAVSVRLSNQW